MSPGVTRKAKANGSYHHSKRQKRPDSGYCHRPWSCQNKITSLNVREVGNGKALAFITIEIKDLAALQAAMNRLRIIPGVSEVERPGVNR